MIVYDGFCFDFAGLEGSTYVVGRESLSSPPLVGSSERISFSKEVLLCFFDLDFSFGVLVNL